MATTLEYEISKTLWGEITRNHWGNLECGSAQHNLFFCILWTNFTFLESEFVSLIWIEQILRSLRETGFDKCRCMFVHVLRHKVTQLLLTSSITNINPLGHLYSRTLLYDFDNFRIYFHYESWLCVYFFDNDLSFQCFCITLWLAC